MALDPITWFIIGSALVGVVGNRISAKKEKKAQEYLNAYNRRAISYDQLITRLSDLYVLNSEQRAALQNHIASSLRGKNRKSLQGAEKNLQRERMTIEADIAELNNRKDTERTTAEEMAANTRNKTSLIEGLS